MRGEKEARKTRTIFFLFIWSHLYLPNVSRLQWLLIHHICVSSSLRDFFDYFFCPKWILLIITSLERCQSFIKGEYYFIVKGTFQNVKQFPVVCFFIIQRFTTFYAHISLFPFNFLLWVVTKVGVRSNKITTALE